MQLVIKPSILKGSISIPFSKSHTMRAILFATLAQGKSYITNYLSSPDTNFMIHACQLLGAHIQQTSSYLEIEGIAGKIDYASDVIHAGNSGIILRFFTALGGLSRHPIVITGDESIRYQRPLAPLLSGLSQLGVFTASMRGDHFAPVIIQGPILNDYASILGVDSQFVSSLLITSVFADHPIHLNVREPGEKPWVEMTLDWFDKLGIFYSNDNFQNYSLKGKANYSGFNYSVPGDFSSAVFPIAAALIRNSELTIQNIDLNDMQGDKKVFSYFEKMGAIFDYDEVNKTLYVKGQGLQGKEFDINDSIDSLPILAVLGCFAEGKTTIKNAKNARFKECDRIHVMCRELTKMGATIYENADGLIVEKSVLHGQMLSSYKDHRVAMALAIAGLGAVGTTIIQESECIEKTFTNFVKEFSLLGANMVNKA